LIYNEIELFYRPVTVLCLL